jgi:hypothetical protein
MLGIGIISILGMENTRGFLKQLKPVSFQYYGKKRYNLIFIEMTPVEFCIEIYQTIIFRYYRSYTEIEKTNLKNRFDKNRFRFRF